MEIKGCEIKVVGVDQESKELKAVANEQNLLLGFYKIEEKDDGFILASKVNLGPQTAKEALQMMDNLSISFVTVVMDILIRALGAERDVAKIITHAILKKAQANAFGAEIDYEDKEQGAEEEPENEEPGQGGLQN